MINISGSNLLDTIAFKTTTPINIKGKEGKRFVAFYRTVGCAYGECTMCGFGVNSDKNVKDENLKRQHQSILKELKKGKYDHFDLLTSGNFFNDNEVSPSIRRYFLTSLSKIKTIKRILVESRRAYLTLEKLNEARNCLRADQILEMALGYESSNSYVRNTILKKGVPEKHLEESMKLCRDAGVDFVSYILIKPHLLSELDAIRDASDTALHIFSEAKRIGVYARVCFEPVFVTPDSAIEEHWKRGDYETLKWWSVAQVMIDVASALKEANTKGKLFIGLSDENLSSERGAKNCGVCDEIIKAELQKFNGQQDIIKLKNAYHGCKDHWNKFLTGGDILEEFIDSSVFLGMHNTDEHVRIGCKNYFVKNLSEVTTIAMNLEQMGKCTETIWHCSEKEQKYYYPFMDKLNTELKLLKFNYTEKDIQESETNSNLRNLRIIDRLKLGMVIARGGTLITVNPYLLTLKNLPIKQPVFGKELRFPKNIENLYQTSLKVRICTKD